MPEEIFLSAVAQEIEASDRPRLLVEVLGKVCDRVQFPEDDRHVVAVEYVNWTTLVYLNMEGRGGVAVALAIGDRQAPVNIVFGRLLAGFLGTMRNNNLVYRCFRRIDGKRKRYSFLAVQEDGAPA